MGKVDKREELYVDWVTETNTETKEIPDAFGGHTTETITTTVIPKMMWILKGNIKREKTIPHNELTPEEIPTPKIFFKSKARVLIDSLIRALSDFRASEHVKVTINDECLSLDAVGDEYSDHVGFNKGDDSVIDIRSEEESVSTFTLSVFLPFLKEAAKISAFLS